MDKKNLEEAYKKRRAEINNILHSYLSDDAIWLASYEGESDWLRCDIAKKGQKYIEDMNKELEIRWARENEKTYNKANLKRLAQAIEACDEKYEKRYGPMAPSGCSGDGSSERIKYALFYISQFLYP